MRLDRILANAGYGSRKEVRALIKSGAVVLHGKILNDEACNIEEAELDELQLNSQPLKPRFSFYFALHKPAGFLSAMDDKKQATVKDFLPEKLLSVGLFPVGRLDIDTTGLLLFTNDGTLGHRLTKPEWHVEKHYEFSYSGEELGEKEVEQFKNGLLIGTWTCRPAQLILRDLQKGELILEEGKFHQDKRMLHAIGREVTRLKRLRHGPVDLQDIEEPGQIRQLSDAEIDSLYSATGLVRPKR